MAVLIFILFLAAAIVFGIVAFTTRSLIAVGFCLLAVAFTLGAWPGVLH